MLSRRGFVNCAICAVAVGYAATGVEASAQQAAQTGGVTRRILGTEPVPGTQFVVVQVAAEIGGGALVARHTHPGIESATILSGEGELLIDGKPSRMLTAGDGFQVPTGTPHSLRNGPAIMRISSIYTVDKDKPLASPA